MLLTKRLSTFLNNNTSPNLHTLLLLTPSGKLLSSSSPSPASTLRTQATIASSIWNQYSTSQTSTSRVASAALPDHPSTNDANEQEISSILIQLEFGTMVIRALQSGLLFVSIGPTPSSANTLSAQRQLHSPEPPSSPLPDIGDANEHQLAMPGGGSRAPSEAGSSITTTSVGGVTSILGMRRQTEELGRWLDGKMEGFALSPADYSVQTR